MEIYHLNRNRIPVDLAGSPVHERVSVNILIERIALIGDEHIVIALFCWTDILHRQNIRLLHPLGRLIRFYCFFAEHMLQRILIKKISAEKDPCSYKYKNRFSFHDFDIIS